MFDNHKRKKEIIINDKYLETIFLRRNPVKKRVYDLNAKNYFSNYGPYIPKDKNIRILDIGCGMGHFLYALKKNGYTNFIGIDISSQMVAFCKEHIKKTELKDDFKEISGQVLKFDAFEFLETNNEKFDFIVANDFIEHIQKDQIFTFFDLVKKNLVNDGIFIAKTANMTNLVSNMLLYDDFTHKTGFTILSLTQIFLLSGFKNVEVHQFIARKSRLITRILRNLFLKFISEIFGVKEIKAWSPLIFGVGFRR